mgnify:FL=1
MKALNHILDASTPYPIFKSYVDSYSHLIGIFKFGWGSLLIDPEIEAKKQLLDQYNIVSTPGGTLFEYFYQKNDLPAFRKLLAQWNFKSVELSRGTISISDNEYADLIDQFSADFTVFSEVGFKSPELSDQMSLSDWVHSCQLSLDAGAQLVILEARESGTAGIVDRDGLIKTPLLTHLVNNLGLESILFEAPIKLLQAHLINLFGTDVNLGNINLQSILPVHALRHRLRSDTLVSSYLST